jgi:uncharacterized alkaline shock family protein YloU
MSGRTEREVKIRFTGESAVLKGSAGEVRKVFQMLTSDLNDSRGAGEKLAAAYEQVADSMRKDMAAIAETADVVRDSLGPEMTQAIEASGRTVEDQVQEWRKLGLTLDDIKRDSDELAAGLKQLDDSARMSAGSVGDGFKKVSAEVDNSKNVMANFAGNAAQELPGVAGAFGPLNMAISQFVEYGAEGNVNLKNLAKMAGPMLAVAVAMELVAKYQREVAEVEAFNTAQVDGFTDSLKAGTDVAEDFRDTLLEAGKVEFNLNRMFGGDALDDMARAGVTFDQFFAAVDGGEDGLQRLADALDAAGVAGEDQFNIMAAATTAQENLTQAHETYIRMQEVGLAPTGRMTGSIEANTDALTGQIDAALEAVTTQESLADAYAEAEEAQRDLTSAQLASIDSQYAAADAQDRFIEAMEALAVATDDPTTGVNELDQAQRTATQAALDMALANQTNAEALAIAAGAPLSVEASNKVLIDSLSMLASSLDENSPVRAAILAHIDTLGGVQPTVATRVTVDIEKAAEDIASVAEAAAELDNTETDTKANADTATALDLVQTLTLAIEGIPKTIGIDVNMSGVTAVLSSVADLRRSLQSLADLSDDVLLSIDAGLRRVKQGTR